MSHSLKDRFSVSVGSAPSGEGEIFQLRRADPKDVMLTVDSFTMDVPEMGVLLEFLLNLSNFQETAINNLSQRGLVRRNHNIPLS